MQGESTEQTGFGKSRSVSLDQMIVETNDSFKRLSDLNTNFGLLLNTEELVQDGKMLMILKHIVSN